eukprot:1789341-Lingulodinium_polyedra.AAC.1
MGTSHPPLGLDCFAYVERRHIVRGQAVASLLPRRYRRRRGLSSATVVSFTHVEWLRPVRLSHKGKSIEVILLWAGRDKCNMCMISIVLCWP